MSTRYATISNHQSELLRRAQEARGDSILGIANRLRLRNLFGIPSVNFGYRLVRGDHESSVESKFDVNSIEAGKDQNPDFNSGVNLNYAHLDAPSFNLEEAVGSKDDALHGAPNIAVPPGSVSNPSLAREGSFKGNIENYPTYDPDNRDGGGFGNFDALKNDPATHREAVGSYLQNYTRGQADNFGNSTK